jgi:hypothetical protein
LNSKILAVDFDGVLHSYSSGWRGVDNIPDLPVEGALQFLEEAVNSFNVAVYSSRSSEEKGIRAMRAWLIKQCSKAGLDSGLVSRIRFPSQKPPAFVGLDDRVLTFRGKFPSMDELRSFKLGRNKFLWTIRTGKRRTNITHQNREWLKQQALMFYLAFGVYLCLNDLWFLLTVVLGRDDMNTREDVNNDWLFYRCQEVQNAPMIA